MMEVSSQFYLPESETPLQALQDEEGTLNAIEFDPLLGALSSISALPEETSSLSGLIHLLDDRHVSSVEASSPDDIMAPNPIDNTRFHVVDNLPLEDSLSQTFLRKPEGLASAQALLLQMFDGTTEVSHSQKAYMVPPTLISASNPAFCLPNQTKRKMDEVVSGVWQDPSSAMDSFILHLPNNKRQRISKVDEDDASNSEDSESSLSQSSSLSRPCQSSQWQEKYDELCEFARKNGHTNVPPKHNDDLSLWRWIKRQRYQYKLKQEGRKPHAISDERIVALEKIGFVWDSQGTLWSVRLNELAEYRKNNGHTNVPSKYPPNHQLSTWVKCQRRQYKLYRDGLKSNMTAERIDALKDLGFVFEPRAEQKPVILPMSVKK